MLAKIWKKIGLIILLIVVIGLFFGIRAIMSNYFDQSNLAKSEIFVKKEAII